MKINADQLPANLKRGLAPVYLVAGDEPLLHQEALDAIRHSARQQGYSGREVFHVDRSFDWNSFRQSTESMSLFSEQRIVELRMPTGKPGDTGRNVIQEYLAQPAEDILLLIVTGKLDASVMKTKWIKLVESIGVLVQVWPVERAHMPRWIAGRMKAAGLQAEADAIELLADRVEGNLLAAVQEIEKLRLLHGAGHISAEQVAEAVADSARFDVFKLMDAVLAGDARRGMRILQALREEGLEPVLVLWAVSREIRQLAGMSAACEQRPLDSVLSQYRVWNRRKPLIKKALQRYPREQWQALLAHCGQVDRMIKGMAAGNAWDELLQLCIQISGLRADTAA
jgi:DNA polymerase-3 subunit delta